MTNNIENVQPEGDGKLQQGFEKLKMNLAAESLFAQSSKTNSAQNILSALVLSPLKQAQPCWSSRVLKRRDPSLPVIVYPTFSWYEVEGADSDQRSSDWTCQ
ncbi:hypothetical protein O9993_07165 [Vibrio lentus]|nr:hypothetical protein [Vibrio lentus]